MWQLGLCIGTLVIVWLSHWVYRWRNPKCSGRLPPGSMGFPLIGETFHFFSPYNSSSDIHPFIKKRMERYGPVFRTSLVGKPMVISTDPELNHFIFQQEGRLFQSWYPDTFIEIFGRQNVGSLHGFMYKYIKSLVLKLFGVESLKHNLMPEMEQMAITTLASWLTKPSIELKEATATMIFDLTAKKLISYDPKKYKENLRENFVAFIEGLISFPINIPGTSYHKCLKGRNKAMKMLKKMLDERLALPDRKIKDDEDFFDFVLEELQKDRTLLTEAIALDLMFALLFASFETTSLALTMLIKYLTNHPTVLEQLTEEHEAIIKNRDNKSLGFTWEEYKSLAFTSQIINETVRLANIAPGIFRKTMENINTKGYTIPKGWGIMVCPPAIHLNPATYDDPLSFNPDRWKGIDTNGGSKDFMAFGGGMRFCVGADFSKLQMAIFLHHLVTKYRWISIKGGDIVRSPGLAFPNGYHIQLLEKN